MKNLIFFLSLSFISQVAMAQFLGKDGNEVTTCDCNDPVNYLDYSIKLPDNYKKYDLIQFVAYRDNSAISSVLFRSSQVDQLIRLSVLNPNNPALRTIFGKEYGLFRGNDFNNISYNSMCEYEFGNTTELTIRTYGITQVGTETTFELESNKTTVKAKTVPVYDGGVELAKSKTIRFS